MHQKRQSRMCLHRRMHSRQHHCNTGSTTLTHTALNPRAPCLSHPYMWPTIQPSVLPQVIDTGRLCLHTSPMCTLAMAPQSWLDHRHAQCTRQSQPQLRWQLAAPFRVDQLADANPSTHAHNNHSHCSSSILKKHMLAHPLASPHRRAPNKARINTLGHSHATHERVVL